MHCPFCHHEETKVLESRLHDDCMRRRRECFNCNNRFTTYERALINLAVIKKDGRNEEFDLNKIFISLQRACGKVEENEIKSLVRKIQQAILNKKVNPLKTSEIGRIVLKELKKFDKMAYLRYASVYKSIEDPKILEKELQTIV